MTDAVLAQNNAMLAFLRAIQRRYRFALAFQILLWAGVALLVGLILLRLESFFALPIDGRALTWAVVVLVCLAALVSATRRSPDLARAARNADDILQLDHYLASALDVQRNWVKYQGLVARAFLTEAEARAGLLDPKKVAPFPTGPTWLATVAVIVAIGGYAGLNALPDPDAPIDAAEQVLKGGTVEDVDLLARLVANVGRQTNDDTLRATADALRELSQDAERGVTQEAFDSRLSSLLNQLEEAFGRDKPDWMPDASGDLRGFGRQLRSFQAELNAQELLTSEMPGDTPETLRHLAAQNELEKRTEGNNPNFAPIPLGADGSSAMRSSSTMQELPPGEISGGASMLGGSSEPDSNEPIDASGAAPIGASLQSGKGDSNIAGLGTQPLAPNADFMALADAQGKSMGLTAAETNDGGRIRIHVAPEAGQTGQGGDRRSVAGEVGSKGIGVATTRETVAPADLAVLGRYFVPPENQPEAGL